MPFALFEASRISLMFQGSKYSPRFCQIINLTLTQILVLHNIPIIDKLYLLFCLYLPLWFVGLFAFLCIFPDSDSTSGFHTLLSAAWLYS